uniref:Uncharacterized protein n=1 Tax=Populus trichocarpa TaxID=3694 RepID=A0A3N7GGI8_POPTR
MPSPKHNFSIKEFTLAGALLSSSQSSTQELLSWIPKNLSIEANLAFNELSKAYAEMILVTDMRGGLSVDGDEISAASARAPVGFAMVATHQFRWLIDHVDELALLYKQAGKNQIK